MGAVLPGCWILDHLLPKLPETTIHTPNFQHENFSVSHSSRPCPSFSASAADHASDIHRTGIRTASHPIRPRVWSSGHLSLAKLRPPGNPVCPRIRPPGHKLRAELRSPGNPVRSRVWPASDPGLAAVWKSTSGGDHLCTGECSVHTTGNPIPSYHRAIHRKLGIKEKFDENN